jgi:GT2 family glycosyltransferase
MKEKCVSVVIPTYNKKESLKKTIESLFDQSYPKDKYEIVVVDDGSTDGTEEIVQKLVKSEPMLSNFIYIKQERGGAAAARNLGIRKSKGDLIFFLDSDVRLEKHALKILVEQIQNERAGAIGPKCYYDENQTKIWCAGGIIYMRRGMCYHLGRDKCRNCQFDRKAEVDYLPSCALLTKRHVIEEIGGFDEDYYIYYEDSDWCLRARRAGYKIVIAPSAHAYHATTDKLNDFFLYYSGRNRFLFMKKHATKADFISFLAWTFFIDFSIIVVASFYYKNLKLLKSYCKGIRDGIHQVIVTEKK